MNAAAQVAQSQLLLKGGFVLTPSLGFVFSGTLFLYALHRINGLDQVAPFTGFGRYKVISSHKSHILVYALLGLAGAGVCFLLLPWPVQWRLMLPGLIALGYVIPAGKGGKRLRDLHFLKIFLIAVVWAWITVWLPAAEAGLGLERSVMLMALERATFIFAITLPFDVRDMRIDQHTRVKTLPAFLGIPLTVALSFFLLLLMMIFAGMNHYPPGVMTALGISAALSAALSAFSYKIEHDYYFSGLLDGMMAVQFLLVSALF